MASLFKSLVREKAEADAQEAQLADEKAQRAAKAKKQELEDVHMFFEEQQQSAMEEFIADRVTTGTYSHCAAPHRSAAAAAILSPHSVTVRQSSHCCTLYALRSTLYALRSAPCALRPALCTCRGVGGGWS